MSVLFPIILGIMPGLIWLFFYLREDIHPEPKKLILYTFVVGGMTTVPVLAGEILWERLGGFINFPNILFLVIGFALIEEFFKFLGAYFAVAGNPALDEPIDAMIYAISAALGFAVVENILILSGSPLGLTVLGTTSLRFVGATLLHTLASGIIGYHWGLGMVKRNPVRNIAVGIIYATALHSLFNYLIIKFEIENLIYPTLLLVIAAFFILNDFEKLKKY